MSTPNPISGKNLIEVIEDQRKEIRRLEDLCQTLARHREAADANRDRFCHHINVIGDRVLGKRDCHAPDAVSRETLRFIEDLLLARPWPDIGPDPLKDRELVDQSEDGAHKRLSRGVVIQQPFVPDQTALVWRIDISRVSMELIWRRSGFRSMKQWIDKLVPALKGYMEHAKPRMVIQPPEQEVLKNFIEIYDKDEIPGQARNEKQG